MVSTTLPESAVAVAGAGLTLAGGVEAGAAGVWPLALGALTMTQTSRSNELTRWITRDRVDGRGVYRNIFGNLIRFARRSKKNTALVWLRDWHLPH